MVTHILAGFVDGRECFPLFAMAVVGTAIVAVAWYSSVRRRQRVELFGRLATRWSGRVEEGGFLVSPRILIRSDGVAGEVSFNDGRNNNTWTRVRFEWPSKRRLRITPQGLATWLRSIFGGAEIEVGDELFDAACWIEGTDAAWTKQVLTRTIRRQILVMHGVTLDLGPGGLTIKVMRLLVDDEAALAQLVELAIQVLKEMRGIRPVVGVVLAEVVTAPGSACPVCGHPVDQPKPCPRCRTPHHEDCWAYAGGCAIFGCESRQGRAA